MLDLTAGFDTINHHLGLGRTCQTDAVRSQIDGQLKGSKLDALAHRPQCAVTLNSN